MDLKYSTPPDVSSLSAVATSAIALCSVTKILKHKYLIGVVTILCGSIFALVDTSCRP